MKRIIAVQHKDEAREGICPCCGQRMIWRDVFSEGFVAGDYIQHEDGYWEHKCDPFICQKCGSPERRETDIVTRGIYKEYHYTCTECGNTWTFRERKEA